MTLLFWSFVDSLLPGLPFVILAFSIYSFYRAYRQWKSGSGGYQKIDGVEKWIESDEKVNFFSIGATVFGLILLACAIGSFIWMQLEK